MESTADSKCAETFADRDQEERSCNCHLRGGYTDSVCLHAHFKVLFLTYKILYKLGAGYCLRQFDSVWSLCSSEQGLLHVPSTGEARLATQESR